LSPELAKISSKEAFGGALASSASSPSPLSSSDFGDLAPLGVDVPKRVAAEENDPKASLGFGTEAFGAGDANMGGLPGAGVGDALEAVLRKGEGLDAKEPNPEDVKFGFGEGEAVREGVVGVEYFANIDEFPPKGENPDNLEVDEGSSRNDLDGAPFKKGDGPEL